jgi:uncharacterized repeat protein (TIGR01451 family)
MKSIEKFSIDHQWLAAKTKMIVLVLFALQLCSSDSRGQGWMKTYGGSGYQGGFNVISNNWQVGTSTKDGGYLIVSTSGLGSYGLFLVLTDSNGNPLIEKTLYGGLATPTDVELLADGNYAIAALLGAGSYGITKLDAQLDTIWSKFTYSTDKPGRINSITSLDDGSIISTGEIFDSLNESKSKVLIKKLNSTGQIEFEKTYPRIPGFNKATGQKIAITASHEIVVVGKAIDSTYNSRTFLLKADSLGNLIWQHTFGDTIIGQFMTNAIELSPNNEYVIGGKPINEFGVSCSKINSIGEIIWSQTWPSSSSSHIYDIKRAQQGGYYILTRLGFYPTIIRIDEQGNTLWTRDIQIETNIIFANEFLSINNNSLFICGAYYADDMDVLLLKTDTLGNLYTSVLSGRVHHDPEFDCLPDSSESGLEGWLVKADGIDDFTALTDENGEFFIALDTGNYTITVTPPGPYWGACNSPVDISISEFYDTTTLDFPDQITVECPYLTVDLSAPFLRRCFYNDYYVHFCNDGTALAENVTVEVELDPAFTFQSATIPPLSQNGNVIAFDVGDLEIGECGNFEITAYLDCDSTVLGQTHCSTAHIYPNTLCIFPDPNWDGSSIEVDVSCDGDSINFTITNVGDAPMSAPLKYIIIEDQIVLMIGNYELGPGQSTTVTLPANGQTIHLEAEQAPGHPSGFPSTGVTIEGCGGWLNLGIFTQWAFDDNPDPFTDVDCQPNVGSFDPNYKVGYPAGMGEEHIIEPSQDIEYLIRFQNTGTDTAFKVVIVDKLPSELDVRTLKPGASSHPYSYDISPEGWPVFTFDNISLPDSATNEPNSHGFIRFRVSPQSYLSNGIEIDNHALIYFDYNPPVITNHVVHKTGQVFPWNLVGTNAAPSHSRINVRVTPNPLTQSAKIEVVGSTSGQMKMVISDLSGRMVKHLETNTAIFEVNRSEMPSGMYLFQIIKDGKPLASGRLVVQ